MWKTRSSRANTVRHFRSVLNKVERRLVALMVMMMVFVMRIAVRVAAVVVGQCGRVSQFFASLASEVC